MKKYEKNLEMVDPQLRNNPDLVKVLTDLENSWEKGMIYLTSPKKCKQLVHVS